MPESAAVKGLGIAGLVLAAGQSARMGDGINKLTEPIAGKPLLLWSVDAMLDAGLDPVFVVTGHDESAVRECLESRACQVIHHPDWSRGMGSSIAAGARAIARLEPQALLVCVGDLPGIRRALVSPLLEAFGAEESVDRIYVPVHDGRRGHPVLFGNAFLRELSQLEGDSGGRALLEGRSTSVIEVEVASAGIFRDVDTPEDLEHWRS